MRILAGRQFTDDFDSSSSVGVQSGATLQIIGGVNGIIPLTLAGTGVGGTGALRGVGLSQWSGPITASGPITIGAALITTLSGAINAPGTITKVGAGTLTLGASNSYTGGTFVNSGTLALAGFSGVLPPGLNVTIGNEAFFMLMEGVASARDIDKALKLGLNHPMGPFELVDLVGLDTRLAILEYLHKSMGEKYRPCPLLKKMVAAGHLGRKSGRGFYAYPG